MRCGKSCPGLSNVALVRPCAVRRNGTAGPPAAPAPSATGPARPRTISSSSPPSFPRLMPDRDAPVLNGCDKRRLIRAMDYREFPPPPELEGLIKVRWTLAGSGAAQDWLAQ